MRRLDVICPVFREEQVIGAFHQRLAVVLDGLAARYACRLIYVLDPSPDGTEKALATIAAADPRVEVLVMSRRFGHQAALVAGMDHADGDAVIMLDSDLQHPPELIPDIVRRWEEGADIVQMVRQEGGETSKLKTLTSRWFYASFLRLSALQLPAGAADYRLVSRRVNETFRSRLREHNPFLRGLISWVGYKVVYLPFEPAKREMGRSKYRPSTLVNFALSGICSFSNAPLRMSISVGLAMAALSIVGAIVQILVYWLGSVDVPGWASLFSAVTLIGGVQLFFFGMLGEFISLIFDEVKNRPRYLLDRHYSRGAMETVGSRAEDAAARPPNAGGDLRTPAPAIADAFGATGERSRLRPVPASGSDLDAVVTRRERSLFEADMGRSRALLGEAIGGRRILVVGGGGSIGSTAARLILDYRPKAVHVLDQSENYLVELVRDLRGRPGGLPDVDFRTFPLDYGSRVTESLLRHEQRYDIVLNFAALKHVRSEKDVHSLLQMLDTNIVRHIRFKQWLAQNRHGAVYFAVSTDKAANPTSLMGASKRLMEDVAFDIAAQHATSTTSARFANVAFSNGSLLHGFHRRIERRQPLAVPEATQRYFISHEEAAELCILAAFRVPDQHVAIPKLDARTELHALDDIAARVLEALGFEPCFMHDEERAKRELETLARGGRWPVLLTPLDTSGEKPYEEFVGEGETQVEVGLGAVAALRHRATRAGDNGLFERLAAVVDDPEMIAKGDIVASITEAMSNFRHVETGRNLDQRF